MDPRQLYDNYEVLVGSGRRLAASVDSDRRRRAVVGTLFGTFGEHIRYGVLAIGCNGPHGYGVVACRLKDVAIRDRVSFLETNSYAFVETHALRPTSEIPAGFRAPWETRHFLAATKLGPLLLPGQKASDWAEMLVTLASTRSDEQFIEAHIFGALNAYSIEAMALLDGPMPDKGAALDAEIALERFQAMTTGVHTA